MYTASNSQERPLNGIHYYRDTHPDWTWPATEQFISKWQDRKKHNKTAKHKKMQNKLTKNYLKPHKTPPANVTHIM